MFGMGGGGKRGGMKVARFVWDGGGGRRGGMMTRLLK